MRTRLLPALLLSLVVAALLPATPAVAAPAQPHVPYVRAMDGVVLVDVYTWWDADRVTVTSSPGGHTRSMDVPSGQQGVQVEMSGLTNGVTYTFTAVAEDASGASEPSAPSDPATPRRAPSAPRDVVATAVDGRAVVSWTYDATPAEHAPRSFVAEAFPHGVTAGTSDGSKRSVTVTGLVNGTTYTFRVTAEADELRSSPSEASAAVTPQAGAIYTGPSTFVAVDPVRIVDTRPGPAVAGDRTTPLGAGEWMDVRVSNSSISPVEGGATAAVLNVTGVGAAGPTDLRVYPTPASGSSVPNVSNLNLVRGSTVANAVTVPLGHGGMVRVRNSGGAVHVLVDVAGYFVAGDDRARFTSLAPQRLLDTRPGAEQVGSRPGPVGAGDHVDLDLTGAVADDATAVVLNVTAVAPTSGTDVRVYPTPSNDHMPVVSSINVPRGVTAPNLVTVKIGEGRKVRLRNAAGSVHLLADIAGYYSRSSTGARFHVVAPARVLDTRPGAENVGARPGAVAKAEALPLLLAGRGGLPAHPVAALLNVTATGASGGTDVRVYPSAGATTAVPLVSNLNVRKGVTVPNAVAVRVGDDGRVLLRSSTSAVHLLADVAGYFA